MDETCLTRQLQNRGRRCICLSALPGRKHSNWIPTGSRAWYWYSSYATVALSRLSFPLILLRIVSTGPLVDRSRQGRSSILNLRSEIFLPRLAWSADIFASLRRPWLPSSDTGASSYEFTCPDQRERTFKWLVSSLSTVRPGPRSQAIISQAVNSITLLRRTCSIRERAASKSCFFSPYSR